MPQSRWIGRVIVALAMAGVFVAGYLTLAHLHKLPLSCDSVLFDCGKVARHPLAHGLGIPGLRAIPTAVLGLLYFVGLAGLSTLRPLATNPFQRVISGLRLGLTGLALAIFALLSAAEMWVIHAWCPWCILSAMLTVALFILLMVERQRERHLTELPAPRSRLAECIRLLSIAVLGTLAGIAGIWYIKYIMEPAPQIASDLTAATLQLADLPLIGPVDAPYTLVQFGHYRCIHCKAAFREIDAMLTAHPQSLRFYFSPATREPDAPFYLLAGAAAAAAHQGQFDAMHHALYQAQDAIAELPSDAMRAAVEKLAGSLNLNQQAFLRDLDAPATRDAIESREAVAQYYHLFPIPQFVLLSPGRPAMLLHSIAQVRERVTHLPE